MRGIGRAELVDGVDEQDDEPAELSALQEVHEVPLERLEVGRDARARRVARVGDLLAHAVQQLAQAAAVRRRAAKANHHRRVDGAVVGRQPAGHGAGGGRQQRRLAVPARSVHHQRLAAAALHVLADRSQLRLATHEPLRVPRRRQPMLAHVQVQAVGRLRGALLQPALDAVSDAVVQRVADVLQVFGVRVAVDPARVAPRDLAPHDVGGRRHTHAGVHQLPDSPVARYVDQVRVGDEVDVAADTVAVQILADVDDAADAADRPQVGTVVFDYGRETIAPFLVRS